jgi:type I restriction enzyme S subunit
MKPLFQKTDAPLENSGIDWLGEIPADWETKKLKFVTKIRKRIAGYEGPDVLSITQQGIKVKDIESGEGQLAQNYSGYQLVYKGDFAMNHMDLLTGYVDISKFDGVVSPDYRVFTNESNEILDEFLLLIFQIGYRQRIFFRYGQGVSLLGRWRFPAENFNEFVIPIPPLNVQKRIVDFLTDKTDKIDRAVKIKEGQIALLRERKQIIIQEAVTKGLNPDAPMKDSGIDWIGQIPAHWDVRRFKFLCKITTGERNTEDKQEEGMYPFFVRSQTPERINSYSFDGEAVLTAGDGAGVGKIYHYINGKFDFHQRVYKFSDFRHLLGKYVYHYLWANFFNVALLGTAKSTVDSLRLPVIQDFWFSFPTSFEEQEEILEHIGNESAKLDSAIELKERQIEALKEYKATLVNAAVTGKIKVI